MINQTRVKDKRAFDYEDYQAVVAETKTELDALPQIMTDNLAEATEGPLAKIRAASNLEEILKRITTFQRKVNQVLGSLRDNLFQQTSAPSASYLGEKWEARRTEGITEWLEGNRAIPPIPVDRLRAVNSDLAKITEALSTQSAKLRTEIELLLLPDKVRSAIWNLEKMPLPNLAGQTEKDERARPGIETYKIWFATKNILGDLFKIQSDLEFLKAHQREDKTLAGDLNRYLQSTHYPQSSRQPAYLLSTLGSALVRFINTYLNLERPEKNHKENAVLAFSYLKRIRSLMEQYGLPEEDQGIFDLYIAEFSEIDIFKIS